MINILSSYVENQSTLIRKIRVAMVVNKIKDIKSFESLKSLAKNNNPDFRETVAVAAGVIGGDDGLKILDALLVGNPNKLVQIGVAKAAGIIGGEKGFLLLKTLSKSADVYALETIAYELSTIRGNDSHQLMYTILQNPVFWNDSSQQYVKNSILYYLKYQPTKASIH